MGSLVEPPPVDQAVQVGLDGGHEVHRLLKLQQAVVADRLGQHPGRIVEGGQQVQVGTGVRRTDYRPPVPPDPYPGLPVLSAGRHVGPTERGLQVVYQGDVQQGVERFAAQLRGDGGHRATIEAGVGRVHRVEDGQGPPVGQPPEWVVALGQGVQAPPLFGVGQNPLLVFAGKEHDLLPAGDRIQHESAGQRETGSDDHWHGEGHHLCTALGRMGSRLQLEEALVDVAGRDLHDVPVELSASGGQRHVGEELARLLVDGSAHAGQELEAGAIEVGHHAAKVDELPARGVPAGHRATLGVVVGAGPGRGETHGAGRQPGPEEVGHGGHLGLGGLPLDCLVAHYDPAQCRVPDLVAGVDGQQWVDGIQELGCGPPVPRHPFPEGLERHPLHPRQHPHQVVAVGRVVGQRGDGETAVAADHGRDAVQRRRAEGAVPERLGVVVGVDVHEARTDDPTVGVQHGGVGGVQVRADRGDAPVNDAHVGAPSGASVAVDDPAPPDQRVVHGAPNCVRRAPRSASGHPGDGSHRAGGGPNGAPRYPLPRTSDYRHLISPRNPMSCQEPGVGPGRDGA